MFRPRALFSLGIFAAAALAPLAAFAQSPGIAWRTNVDAAKLEAGQSNRLLLLHFWRPSCGPCRVLDQTVFNQPHVGAAVERSFVPVKVDTEASPAQASFFRIEQVPTDVIIDGHGHVIATLPCPMSADAYLGQLENLVRHVRQSQANAPIPGSEAPPVNAAYANLPMSRTTPTMPSPPADGRYAAPAAAPQQTNPWVAAAPAPGQAQASYPAPGAATPSETAAANATPPGTGLPSMPANAMPRSYQAQATSPTPAVTQNQYVATPPAAQKPIELPAGCPPLAFDGCCAVTLKTYKKWATGDATYGAVHRGRTYLFVGSKERDQFMANPDAYSPVFAGLDPVLLLDNQQSVAGSRKFGYEFDGRFYLFSSRETMDRFASNAPSYAAGVRQAMSKIDGVGSVRR